MTNYKKNTQRTKTTKFQTKNNNIMSTAYTYYTHIIHILYTYYTAYTRRSKIDEMVYAIVNGALPQLS